MYLVCDNCMSEKRVIKLWISQITPVIKKLLNFVDAENRLELEFTRELLKKYANKRRTAQLSRTDLKKHLRYNLDLASKEMV